MKPSLVVRGIKGFLRGEEVVMKVGDTLTVGRSRGADLSLRKARRLLQRDDIGEVMGTEAFLSVSRRHVRIHYMHPGLIEIKDLSRNGTFVDGRKVDCVALTDLKARQHIVALGSVERLLLEMPAYKQLGVETDVAPDDD
jgi:pSer/pThr/pTyr-binding forkhead associated (FHA) protein